MTDRDLKVRLFDAQQINDGTNYSCGLEPALEWGLPDVKAQMAKRDGSWPVLGGVDRPGKILYLTIEIRGSDVRTLRDQLMLWFDPEDETAKNLVIEDEDGTNDRYVKAICERIAPMIIDGRASDKAFFIRLRVDGDVRWLRNAWDTDSWSITASGQTNVVANDGTTDAYPQYEITPTTDKADDLAWKQFIPVTWRSDNSAALYPVRLGPLDTAALTPAKMQADGDDLRVYINGRETYRWLIDMDTANTYIWINVPRFAPKASASLQTQIIAAGSINSIEVGEDVYDFPDEGMVLINSEMFVYTGRDLSDEKLTGITRGAHGSTQALHAVNDTVWWIQKEIIICYGNSTLSAPTVDDDYKPAFSRAAADSSNTVWKYNNFGDTGLTRSGRWHPEGNITMHGTGGLFTGHWRSWAATYSHIGAWIGTVTGNAYGWRLYNPCGIVNADWADGAHRATVKEDFLAYVGYWIRDDNWWTWQAEIADPVADATWDTWSEAAGAAWSTADYLTLSLWYYLSDVEASTVTVTLDSTETPAIDMTLAEMGNYKLNCKITNTTTSEWMTVDFEMALNQTLTIDTYDETVTYGLDGSSQFQALDWSSIRLKWLKLEPGNNTLQFDDTGTGNVTFVTKFRKRYY